MIGAFPIGSVPLGSNQSAGKQTIELGSALSTADGLLMNTGVSLGKGDASASSGATSILSKLSTLPASSNSNAVDATTKTLPRMLFAHAIASGESIDNLQIRLKIDRADATSNALNLTGLQRIDFGRALAQSQGIDFSGLKIGLFRADSLASVNTFGMGIPLITGGLSAAAQGIVPLVKPELLAASSTIQAYEFEPMILNILIGEMIASAKDGDLTYIVTGVPDIIVTRSSDFTENQLKVLNYNNENINIYRADDHRGIFELLEQAEISPYTDSSLDKTLNYKYKAAFVVTGTKGGVEVVVEGEKSNAIYTIGNKTL